MQSCRRCNQDLPIHLYEVQTEETRSQACPPCLKIEEDQGEQDRRLMEQLASRAEASSEADDGWYTSSSPHEVNLTLPTISPYLFTSQPSSLQIQQPSSDSPWAPPAPPSVPSPPSQPSISSSSSSVRARVVYYGLDSQRHLTYWDSVTKQPVHPGAEQYLQHLHELRGEMPSILLRPDQIPDTVAARESAPVSAVKQPRDNPVYGHGRAPAGEPNDSLRLELPSHVVSEIRRERSLHLFLKRRLASLYAVDACLSTIHGYAIVRFDTVDDARAAKVSTAWDQLLGPGIEVKWYDEETELAALNELREQEAETAIRLALSSLTLERQQRERLFDLH